jgi:hypothetical protein
MALDFPTSPTVGQVYAVGDQSWQWNGTSWVAVASADTTPPVFVGSFPPTYSEEGFLWWNSTTGQMFVRYDEAWVAATVPPVASQLDPDAVIDGLLARLPEYADQAAAIAAGVPSGGLYRVPGTGSESIRVVV